MSIENGNGNFTKPMLGDVNLGKLLCKVGWHKFTCKMQDCIDEFGYVPNDGRMPKVAKCSRCGVNYR
jgi:hypothetical protein